MERLSMVYQQEANSIRTRSRDPASENDYRFAAQALCCDAAWGRSKRFMEAIEKKIS